MGNLWEVSVDEPAFISWLSSAMNVGLEDIPLYSFMNHFMNDSTVFVVTAASLKFFKGNPSFEHNLQMETYATL